MVFKSIIEIIAHPLHFECLSVRISGQNIFRALKSADGANNRHVHRHHGNKQNNPHHHHKKPHAYDDDETAEDYDEGDDAYDYGK